MTLALGTAPPPTPAGMPGPGPDPDAPLPGVASPIISAATRRVARRWQEEAARREGAPDGDIVAGVLAALALAVDQRRPSYVTELVPPPAPGVGHRLAEMLQSELLRAWSDARSPVLPSAILETLNALERVRDALDRHEQWQGEERIIQADGLDLLVEVIHDLRSPLSSILFLAETLQRGQSGDVNDVQRRQLGLIYSAALGLSSVVSDALELARGGDELADTEAAPFSCAELLESVRDIVRPMADEKGLVVRMVAPADDRRVGHAGALSRALLNLTTNALKFTERGFVEIACQDRAGDQVEFSVQDSGPGINPEALASLFQPFRRARGRPGYAFSGTGLGLAITRKLVEALGAQLQLETRPGWGTRFFFELPLPRYLPVLTAPPRD